MEELRPILINSGRKTVKGFFHQWYTKKDEEYGELVFALVEYEDGKTDSIWVESNKPNTIQFTDRNALQHSK